MDVRSWLKKLKPHSVRVWMPDGSKDELAIDQKDARRWARASESIANIAPLKLDALDPKGKIIGTTLLDGPEEEPSDKPAGRPEGESELGELARHLNVSADNAAKHVREASKEAMAAMAQVTQIAVGSLDKAAQAVDRLTRRLEQAERQLSQRAEGEGGDVPSMLLQGMMMRQLGPAGAAMMQRGAASAAAAGDDASGGELGEYEPTEEEAAEIGRFFVGMIAKRAAKATAPPPTPPPNGAAQPQSE